MSKRNYLMLALLAILILPALVCKAEAAEKTFEWTAPADYPDTVKVDGYEIRICYCSSVAEFDWDAAQIIYTMDGFEVGEPGASQSFYVNDLPVEIPMVACIRAYDDATDRDGNPTPNWNNCGSYVELYFGDGEPPTDIADFR